MSIIDNFMTKKTNPFSSVELTPQELYAKLKGYYDNNGLYTGIQAASYYSSTWVEAIKPLRTVVNRSVEFFVSKIIPGDLSNIKIVTDNEKVKEAITQIWKWSNFSAQKQVAIRYLSLYGDLFIKVASDTDKVYFEIIEPKYVTDFKADSRGYITEIRLDIPIKNEDDKNVTHTEYWNKEYFATWEHELGDNVPLDQLGDTKDFGYLAEFGIDFVPFVHIKFRDTGELRGKSCVAHALDKIDEANREATRLTQLLFRFNKPVFVVSANDKDSTGRPMPAPRIKTGNSKTEDLEIKDNSVLYLPGVSTIQPLIPNINFDSALKILQDMMNELNQDLPELRYYSLQESQLSGKAICLLLAGAIDRAEEARGNFIQGLVRLNQMALTIGSNFFQGIGRYELGSFEHSIQASEMFPSTLEEKATTLQLLVSAGFPLSSAMKNLGFSDDEISETLQAKVDEQSQSDNALASSLMRFNEK